MRRFGVAVLACGVALGASLAAMAQMKPEDAIKYRQSAMFLVGQNGSGKSNFLDALRLVADSLNSSLDHALRERGGIKDVRRRSGGHPTHFGIRLDFRLPDGREGLFHQSFRFD